MSKYKKQIKRRPREDCRLRRESWKGARHQPDCPHMRISMLSHDTIHFFQVVQASIKPPTAPMFDIIDDFSLGGGGGGVWGQSLSFHLQSSSSPPLSCCCPLFLAEVFSNVFRSFLFLSNFKRKILLFKGTHKY